MDEDDLENFEETIRCGRMRSIKAKLVMDDDDDVLCLILCPSSFLTNTVQQIRS
jgi:hypothetical protein